VSARSGGIAALVPGDAESNVLGRLGLGVHDVLVVPHHGSSDTGLARVLTRIRPTLAVVSAGAGNRHGHPAADTLAALTAAGSRIARTDEDGDVAIGAGATLAR
jgi:competence protein ComEC